MKYILILSTMLLASCSGSEAPSMLTDIEICLDQGGEWQGDYCEYEDEKPVNYMFCKPDNGRGQECPKRGRE